MDISPRQPDFSSIGALIQPRSVAVIGASSDPGRIGGRPIRWMLQAGFAGRILPVNPGRDQIQGLPAYASIADLPEVPDAAIVAVPAAHVAGALEDLGRRGTRAAIIFSSGFAEMGADGAAAQAGLLAIAQRHGMRLLGPNSLGLFNGRNRFYASFTTTFETGWPHDGAISIVSQSGAFGSHIATLARNRGLGAPLCVMTGNEADVSVGEVIGWLASDPATRVIVAYMEGIKHGPTLLAGLAAARAAKKPVILMKVGRSALGSHAAQSHTASIAGDDLVADAVFRDSGAIRAQSAEQLLDFAEVAAHGIYPARNRLEVMTVSGGAGVLMSDAAEAEGVEMPAMPQATQDRLRAVLPFAAFRNPLDCTAHLVNDHSLLNTFLGAMMEEGDYDAIVTFFAQIAGTEPFGTALHDTLAALRARWPDRLQVLVAVVDAARQRRYAEIGVPVFEDASRAVAAVGAMIRLGAAFAAKDSVPPPLPAPASLPNGPLTEAAAKALLADHGIPCAPEQLCPDADAALRAAEGMGYPVVMKIVSPDIAHKTEIGGVLLGLADAGAVRAGFATLIDRARAARPEARIEGVLVARQITGGTELIMGIKDDPVFGPVAMVGLGGIFTEVLRDVALRRCPVNPAEAEAMIRSLRGAALLTGARCRPPADVPAAARVLSALSVFAAANAGRIAGIDLNPVTVLPEGAFALDALIETS